MPKNIMLVAGEASGDIAASILIRDIKKLNENISFFGIAGDLASQAGLRTIYPCKHISVTGFIEVLQHLKSILSAMNLCKKALKKEKPDMLVLVDYPGFNLKLAKYAKKIGIPVFYYISPKIWAWKQSRINIIRKTVAHMAVIFPFEVDIYSSANIPVTLVSHPSLEKSKANKTKAELCIQYNLDHNIPIICLMPGSRKSEIKNHLATMTAAANTIAAKIKCQFIIPIASTIDASLIKDQIPAELRATMHIIEGDQYNIIAASDQIVAASGTAALEIALLGKPLCVIYKTSKISYAIAKRVIKVPFISLPNIIAGKQIIPEFIQDNASVSNIAQWVLKLQQRPELGTAMCEELNTIKKLLTANGTVINVATCLQRQLEKLN
ncbi:MAG: lipid-A-disaccharide synthase [Legionellales bacterium]|nr:lipid-A-disaccharide synthase [Legionellales bacterium]